MEHGNLVLLYLHKVVPTRNVGIKGSHREKLIPGGFYRIEVSFNAKCNLHHDRSYLLIYWHFVSQLLSYNIFKTSEVAQNQK